MSDAMNTAEINPTENLFNPVSLWEKSSEVLKDKLDPSIYSTWIEPLNFNVVDNSNSSENSDDAKTTFELVASSKFGRDQIKKNYAEMITSALIEVIGNDKFDLNFNFSNTPQILTQKFHKPIHHTQSNLQNSKVINIRTSADERLNKFAIQSNLNPNYIFSNFVVGPCNLFAFTISQKVSEEMGTLYNPLFLYGGVGLGKTHLASAIGNVALKKGKRGLFTSAEHFLNELVVALRDRKTDKFREKYRSVDFLIIDDVQFLCKKDFAQEEVFHTFNHLYQNNKQIVITSDRIPQELVGLEDRLKTRFACGLSVDLQKPDLETRIAILMEKAEVEKISLPQEVAQYLAQQIDSNVRELEGALNRLKAMSSVNNAPITMDLAINSLGQILCYRPKAATVLSIQEASAQYFKVSIQDILGKRRTSNIALARQVAMYLCRNLTPKSFPDIGSSFGDRDHSTVIHACKTIEAKISADNGFAADVNRIKTLLSNE